MWKGLHTCLLFGHQFRDEPDPWTRIAEALGLTGLGRDQLLDAMNSAGEASGSPLLVCIDAINETKPLNYWRNRLMPLLQAVSSRRFLRFCFVCRTPYVSICTPEGNELLHVEHQGFSGLQRLVRPVRSSNSRPTRTVSPTMHRSRGASGSNRPVLKSVGGQHQG